MLSTQVEVAAPFAEVDILYGPREPIGGKPGRLFQWPVVAARDPHQCRRRQAAMTGLRRLRIPAGGTGELPLRHDNQLPYMAFFCAVGCVSWFCGELSEGGPAYR